MPRLSAIADLLRTGDGKLRTRMAGIGHLLSGNFLNAGIMLVSIGIAARALGPHDYGILVMVLAFGRTVERIVRFESWQPLIAFAAEPVTAASPRLLARLYCYGLLFDLGAAVLAALSTVLLALLLGPVFGIAPDTIDLVAIYSIALLFDLTGMPTAVLRMTGRFRTIAYNQTVFNLVQVALAAWCWQIGAGLRGFVIVWTVTQILGALLFLAQAFRALRETGVPSPLRVRLRELKGGVPGFWSFAWSSNLSMTLRTLTNEGDSLLVGFLAGAPAAGFYSIAKRTARVAQQVGAQVQAVVYPDLARMWAAGSLASLRVTTLQIQAVLAAAGLTLLAATWLLGPWLVPLAFGDDFSPAYPLLVTQMIAVIFLMHAGPSRSALLAMGRHRLVLYIALLGAICFFATAWVLVDQFGAIGATISHIVMAAIIALLMDLAWLRAIRRPRPPSAS